MCVVSARPGGSQKEKRQQDCRTPNKIFQIGKLPQGLTQVKEKERNDIGNETNPIDCSFVKRLDAGRRPGEEGRPVH
jgi:hypothetical protein